MKKILFILFVTLIVSCKKESDTMQFNKLINSESYYTKNDWETKLNYQDTNLFSFTISESGTPFMDVKFGDNSFPLMFDFGNGEGLVITTALKDKIDYSLTGEDYLNYDGSVNPDIFRVKIPEIELFNKKYYNVDAVIEHWNIVSNQPFNGMISMDYLNKFRFTLDYKKQLLAITSEPFPFENSGEDFVKLDLIKIRYHENKVYFLGKINDIEKLIIFDTGYSETKMNIDLVDAEKIVSNQRGNYYKGNIKVRFDEIEIEIQNPRVEKLGGSIEYDYPVGIILGSDMLKYFVLTIDRTNNNNFLLIHK